MALDPSLYINREVSWLEFNARVLHEAFDPRNPLLERLKFLAIFSTNLDEFYMVRVAGLRRQIAAGVQHVPPDGMTPAEQLDAILKQVAELVGQQQQCLYDVLLPELEQHGIRLVRMEELTPEEMQRVDQFFESQVFPVLTPLAVDPGHPFPYISNLSLSLAVQVYDPATDTTRFSPRHAMRICRMEARTSVSFRRRSDSWSRALSPAPFRNTAMENRPSLSPS